MKSKVLLVILAVSLVCVLVSDGAAGQIGYRMRGEEGFGLKPEPGPPSSAAMAADALIGRPLGMPPPLPAPASFWPPCLSA